MSHMTPPHTNTHRFSTLAPILRCSPRLERSNAGTAGVSFFDVGAGIASPVPSVVDKFTAWAVICGGRKDRRGEACARVTMWRTVGGRVETAGVATNV